MNKMNEKIIKKYYQQTPKWFADKAKATGKEDKPLVSVESVMRFNYLRNKYLPGYVIPCTEASLMALEDMDE